MMNILHINTNYIGNPLHQNMIKSLDDKDVCNSVFVPTHNATGSCIKPADNVVVSECFKKFDRINYYSKQKKIMKSLKENYDITNFDCIHAYTVFTDGNVAYKLSKEYNIPYVIAVRNTDINTFFKFMPHLRSRGVEILRNASAIFFLSPVYKERLIEKYVGKKYAEDIEKKSYVMPNGLDDYWLENIFKEKTFDDADTINIACVGNIDSNKNMLSIAEAIKYMTEKNHVKAHLHIAGKITKNKIMEKLQSYEFVTYEGVKTKEELIKLYRENDIFVLPSFHESFGMVYIEAMSQGLPVIYTRNEGFDGQFDDGVVGYSVNPHDIREIAEKMMMAYRNKADLSVNALSLVEKYSWNSLTQKYKLFYEKAVN